MSWEQLLAVYALNSQEQAAEANQAPSACPRCGEPLRTGPSGELFCIADGWQGVW